MQQLIIVIRRKGQTVQFVDVGVDVGAGLFDDLLRLLHGLIGQLGGIPVIIPVGNKNDHRQVHKTDRHHDLRFER